MKARDIVDRIDLPNGWVLRLDEFLPGEGVISPEGTGFYYLQVRELNGVNNATGETGYAWGGRKWALSSHMTETEIVNTAWLALKQAMEHELAEQFLYMGVAVNNPHVSISERIALAQHEEDRRAA